MTDAVDPELLERMRRGVPLRLSAGGAWWFGDDPVTHPGVARALTGGLDLSEGGEPIVVLGQQFCYVRVDDTPLRVLAVREHDGELWVGLDDGRELVLDASSLAEDGGGLRCTVPSRAHGRPLRARFTNRSIAELARWITWDDAERPSFVHGERRVVIPAV